MSIEKHAEYRSWVFHALDDLQRFTEDSDFEGDREEEQRTIKQRRRELRENKYRVVVVGPFNVGKSALINSLLGDEYLPTVLEECTTKITQIVKAERPRAVLRLTDSASDAERMALKGLLDSCSIQAVLADKIRPEPGEDEDSFQDHQEEGIFGTGPAPEIALDYPSVCAKDLVRTLRALVTMNADEDFPQLKALRAKLDEIFVYLPTDLLEDDIALVDTPGVHSITETKEKVARETIPQCHLIVYMLDSQNAGNQQNREFIESVVRQKNRKIFFIINKSDQLNPEEIDPSGHRGPAKDLFRSLGVIGDGPAIVDDPELFFISSLYALVAAQLSRGKITLDHIDQNNKIKIPLKAQREFFASPEPEQAIADYLLAQSNLPALRTRLINYLYGENREGAIVESVARHVEDRTWTYARPLEIKLEIAKDNPRLAELTARREQLSRDIIHNETLTKETTEKYDSVSRGSDETPGYESLVEARITRAAADENVLKPLRAWIASKANVKSARKKHFDPLVAEVESVLDGFLQSVYSDVNGLVDRAEKGAFDQMGDVALLMPDREAPVTIVRPSPGALHASLFGSYIGFMALGAVVAGAAGVAVATQIPTTPGIDTLVSDLLSRLTGSPIVLDSVGASGAVALACAAVGAAAGWIVRAATGGKALYKRLNRAMTEKVVQVLGLEDSSAGQPVRNTAVRSQFKELLTKRREAFRTCLDDAFRQKNNRLYEEFGRVSAEEDRLRAELDALIARLEPKASSLTALRAKAREVAEASAPKGTI